MSLPSPTPEVLVSKDPSNPAIARVAFSNPAKYNALSLDMWQALPGIFQKLDADPTVRVIIMEGEGEAAFAAGADISKFEGQQADPKVQAQQSKAVEDAYLAPVNCSKPVIAKVRGICFGGGFGLAAACDIRICAADARFRMPAARLGLGYNLAGVRRFMQVLGVQNALDVFYTAKIFDAQAALQMGLALQVWPKEEIEARTLAYASHIATLAPLTIRAVKLAVSESLKLPNEAQLSKVYEAISACGPSEDHAEGARAFMERREPVFKGR